MQVLQLGVIERLLSLHPKREHIPSQLPPFTSNQNPLHYPTGGPNMPLTHFLSMIAFVIIAAALTVVGIHALGLPIAVMGLIALFAAVTLRATLWR
jgi:hypothetical protein